MRKFYHWSILIITMIALLPADLHAQGHTFVFDSVQHVRCPDGDLNNYPNDGAFSVHLTDSAQYYQQIRCIPLTTCFTTRPLIATSV